MSSYRTSPDTLPRRRAFSITELLIAVAILAVLASLLVPNLIRAKDNALSASCLANLRTIGIALTSYSVENRGRLPGPQYEIVNMWGVLPVVVAEYLGNSEAERVWACPANKEMTRRNAGTWNKYASYISHYPLFGYPLEPANPNLPAFTIAQIREEMPKEEQWLLRDVDYWAYPDVSIGGAYGPVHNGGRNVLYLDAHVEWVRSVPGVKP